MPRFSIIVPTLNEETTLPHTLATLARLDPPPEIIVVDGGSTDHTRTIAGRCPGVRVLQAARGRAAQMNAGSAAATGDWLLFLHADTVLEPDAYAAARHAAATGPASWGWFDIRFDDTRPTYRLHGWLIGARARLRGTPTGDQGIFVRRDTFHACAGYPELPLMEDVALVRRLRATARGRRIAHPVITSARRWRELGLGRTILRMWWFKLQYLAGQDPHVLAARYRDVRERAAKPDMTGVLR